MIKIVTIIGARPQFIKASAISKLIRSDFNDQIKEVLIHTGQHSDEMMSNVFFKDLGIGDPTYNLGISEESHGMMTGKMLQGVENTIKEKPDCVLVYGDTIQRWLGSSSKTSHTNCPRRGWATFFNKRMPEEINRILTDHVSTLLFCPTATAVSNLELEGLTDCVFNVGDVMCDVASFFNEKLQEVRVSSTGWS